MKNIYPLIYNNYSTRIIKQEDSIYDYSDYLCGDIMRNVNFIPGDGVDTSLIINSLSYTLNSSPDYIVVADMDGNIHSRWYVMKSERTTNGQYRFTLHRDVIVDYLDDILSSDVFIQRGKVLDTDPAIWNSEDIPFNQIKQSETLLKDYTGMPWLVAYISPDVAQNSSSLNGSIEGYYDKEYSSLDNYPFYKYVGKNYTYSSFNVYINTGRKNPPDRPGQPATVEYKDIILKIMANGPLDAAAVYNFSGGDNPNLDNLGQPNTYDVSYLQSAWWKYSKDDAIYNNAVQIQGVAGYIDSNTYSAILNENNKRIKIGTAIYKITVTNNKVVQSKLTDGAIYTAIKSMQYEDWLGSTRDVWDVIPPLSACRMQSAVVTMTIEEVQDDTSAFTYDFKGVNIANPETPYGIITMPYEDYVHLASRGGSTESIEITKENRMKIMQALGKIDGLLYDIQLLPYCPVQNLTYDADAKTFTLANSSADSISVYALNPTGDNTKDYFGNDPTKPVSDDNPANLADPNYANWIKGDYITSIYVAPRANISFNIECPITLTNVKMQNSTDMWRLCSPNYASTFEFNAAKFYEGSLTTIQFFEVDMCCKPYTPYIHVNPHFSGLYNRGDVNFNDARGLICSGDFSIDRINDSWETYKYNQKNWESSFNRQIDTMEFQKKFQFGDSVANGVLGTIGGIFGGSLLAGWPGAIIGGIASAGAAGYNIWEQQQLSQRNIDDTKAQFAYNNQNIRAQPYSIQKVSAINNNNKYFPVLEYYTCTEKEKELFRNYLKYYAMNVNRVDNIQNYIYDDETNYIQAKLLRNTDIEAPTNIYNAINMELTTGIYMEG